MSEASNRALRGGLRALTGVVIVGVAATSAVLVGAADLPVIERPPVAVTVDAQHGAERPFVCSGAFAELGADSAQPSVSIPRGDAVVSTAGEPSRTTELEREESGGTPPEVQWVPAGVPFAASQSQQVVTDDLKGVVASSCAEPANEQWLVGGATTIGVSTTLTVGNPSQVPATVHLSVYDENGEVDSALTTGVLVPAGSQRVVSLNGYAPSRERLAVRVESTGATVTASMGIGHVKGLIPFAVDTVTRQLAAGTTLVVPGVTTLSDAPKGPNDTGDADEFPVVVRALSPSGESGTATVRALLSDGGSEELGSLDLDGSSVSEMPVTIWPENANAVVIDSTVPIVGSVLAQSVNEQAHDYAWFAPAQELPAGAEAAVAGVDGGQLVLANPGSESAEVVLAGAGVSDVRATVPAGAAIAMLAPSDARITSSVPIHAAIRVTSGGVAGYPVLAEPERASELTVYPR